MAVSCRVIGMGIDEAFASEVSKAFGPLHLDFDATDRNMITQAFVSEHCHNGRLTPIEVPGHVEIVGSLDPLFAGTER
jgi:hypothetical protein